MDRGAWCASLWGLKGLDMTEWLSTVQLLKLMLYLVSEAVWCNCPSFSGEIRCYCDAAHCVATGYMCKSELSACFSRLLDPQNTNSPLTHGCLDSLASTADICQARQARNHSGSLSPSLECCHEDMCNYRGLQDVLTAPKGEASGRSGTPSDQTLAWPLGLWQPRLCLSVIDFVVDVIRDGWGRSQAGCKDASLLSDFHVCLSPRYLAT